jgi:adenylosuccinate synthase
MLARIGVDTSRIKISDRAHIVFPYHAALDRASERERGESAIGTTGRGIGPAYGDKVGRIGVTFRDLSRPEALANKIRRNLIGRATLFGEADGTMREEDLIAQTLAFAKRIRAHVVDGVSFIHEYLESGKRVLIEGAQGTLLDIGYGTYPFVTSSHTIAGGACTGLGIGPTQIGRVRGIAKAYCTRVGAGPFPSELFDATSELLRERGGEFGTVTGRPRRCGWFDAVAGRYAVRLNGLSDLMLTKLDVLSGFERIGIVTGYRSAGTGVGFEAYLDSGLGTVVEWHDGWHEDITSVRRIDELPANALRYIERIAELLTVPIGAVSVGPERSALAL